MMSRCVKACGCEHGERAKERGWPFPFSKCRSCEYFSDHINPVKGLLYKYSTPDETNQDLIFTTAGKPTISLGTGTWNTSPPLPDKGFYYDYTVVDGYDKWAIKGETMYYLWQVFLVYGKGDTCSPCMPKHVIAKDMEEAKIKSGVYKQVDDSWDSEYVTIICLNLGEVKVPIYQSRRVKSE